MRIIYSNFFFSPAGVTLQRLPYLAVSLKIRRNVVLGKCKRKPTEAIAWTLRTLVTLINSSSAYNGDFFHSSLSTFNVHTVPFVPLATPLPPTLWAFPLLCPFSSAA